MKRHHQAISFCEEELIRQKNYCLENKIHPGWPKVIDNLLSRQAELEDAYQDIFSSLHENKRLVSIFFDGVLCGALVWSENNIAKIRDAEKQLETINHEIADTASRLSKLMQQRNDLEEIGDVGSTARSDLFSLVEEAGSKHGEFQLFVKDQFAALHHKFDWKYWPNSVAIIQQIAKNFANADVRIYGDVSAQALRSGRRSKANTIRAVFERVYTDKDFLGDFKLKDDSWASLMNCLLELAPEELVDGPYIKRLRQRMRKA